MHNENLNDFGRTSGIKVTQNEQMKKTCKIIYFALCSVKVSGEVIHLKQFS
jgi:hypothetical protein